MESFYAYLLIVNACGFLLMLTDKFLARKKCRRIPEATLMLVAVIGGSIGSLAGMYTVRHKTRHLKFTLGIPLLLVLQAAVAVYFLFFR